MAKKDAELRDPRHAGPKPPLPAKKQAHPGSDARLAEQGDERRRDIGAVTTNGQVVVPGQAPNLDPDLIARDEGRQGRHRGHLDLAADPPRSAPGEGVGLCEHRTGSARCRFGPGPSRPGPSGLGRRSGKQQRRQGRDSDPTSDHVWFSSPSRGRFLAARGREGTDRPVSPPPPVGFSRWATSCFCAPGTPLDR